MRGIEVVRPGVTLGDGVELPPGAAIDRLKGQWEAYQILTTPNTVWLIGSDARGEWVLRVIDSARSDVGTLRSWTLELGRSGGGGAENESEAITANISIPDEQAETITTVGQAVAYLEEHVK